MIDKDYSYDDIHRWIKVEKGQSNKCEYCKKIYKNLSHMHWANKSGEYKKDVNDWLRLCRWCHKKYDSENWKWDGNKWSGGEKENLCKIMLTMSDEVKREIRKKAGEADKSMNAYILDCVKKQLENKWHLAGEPPNEVWTNKQPQKSEG
jgi:hypothetical protein